MSNRNISSYLIFTVKVKPRSSESKIILDKAGNIAVYVKSPPENGKANKELIELFSEKLKIPKLDIEIVSGLSSRKKLLKLLSINSFEELISKLNLGYQQKIDSKKKL